MSTDIKRLHAYDFLMVVAIIFMIVDHVGLFFLTDIESLRIVGRVAAPLFLFLAGYGNSYVKPSYVFYGFILTYLIGDYPLDILITFFLLSLFYQYLIRFLSNFVSIIIVFYLSIIMSFLSLYLSYGFFALLFFMAGKSLYNNNLIYSFVYLFSAFIVYFAFYYLFFYYNDIIFIISSIFLSLVFGYFYNDVLTIKRKSNNYYFCLISRYSLQIYIVHIAAFSLLAAIHIN